MSSELVKIEAPTPAVNFSSKLFQLKPGTININQPTTQAEGAIKGQLRISETGENFQSMRVALLVEPIMQRQYHVGEQGQNRKPENLMCFSRNADTDRPDDKAKVPQALKCSSCPRSDWEPWRQNKAKENIPPCDDFWYTLLIDTEYQLPLQMFIRSKNKKIFERAMKEVSRLLYKMNVQGLNPNYYDVSFTLKAKKDPDNTKTTTYILDFSDFRIITPEERELFGDAYKKYTASRSQNKALDAETEAADQIDQIEAGIDSAVTQADDIQDAEIVV